MAAAIAVNALARADMSYDTFMQLPYETRRARIGELPAEQRLDAYLYMVYELEPEDGGLVGVVAANGSNLSLAVRARLEGKLSDDHRVALVDLVWMMHAMGTIDARSDESFLALLDRVRAQTEGEIPRSIIARKLDDLRSLKSGWYTESGGKAKAKPRPGPVRTPAK